jgi:hypothetical protein
MQTAGITVEVRQMAFHMAQVAGVQRILQPHQAYCPHLVEIKVVFYWLQAEAAVAVITTLEESAVA